MAKLIFIMFGTFMALIISGVIYIFYSRLYRRIPTLDAFTISQKRVLIYQLLAISLWTIGGMGIFLYSLWFDNSLKSLSQSPINIIIAILNWSLFGFIAVTSLIPGVSIIGYLRSWGLVNPAKGKESIFIGVIIFIFLAFWTWKYFLPGL